MAYSPEQFMTGGPEAFGLPKDGGDTPAAAAVVLLPTDPATPFASPCPLAVPIHHDGARLALVILRPLTLAEVRAFTSEADPAPFAILSAMSGLPAAALEKLSWPDAAVVLARAQPMLPDGLREGLV